MAKKAKPQTAEMKAAQASLRQATQLGIEQSMARTRSISRGFVGGRSLRGGGTSIDNAYSVGKYKDDPGAIFGGGYVPPTSSIFAPPTPKRPKPPTSKKPPTKKPPAKPPTKPPTKKPPNAGGRRPIPV